MTRKRQSARNKAQAASSDTDARLAELEAEAAVLRDRVEELAGKVARRDIALIEKAERLESSEKARHDLEARLERQHHEIHVLTERAEDYRNTLTKTQQDCSRAEDAGNALAAELAKRAEQAEAFEKRRQDLAATVERQRKELGLLTERLESLPADVPVKPEGDPGASPAPANTRGLRLLGWILKPRRSHTASVRKQVAELRKSEFFDSVWYAATYPQCASPAKAAEHYVREGAFIGNDPSPAFSTSAYYQRTPDVEESDWPALSHYLFYGKVEGRRFDPVESRDDD